MRKSTKKVSTNQSYRNFREHKPELTLNDYLAIDRTSLSIERTHLSYMRTVVSMVVAAITFIKILGGIEGVICALILLGSALYFYIRGKKVCSKISKNLKYVEDEDD